MEQKPQLTSNHNSHSPNPISLWRFWVPLLFQMLLILAVPARAIYTHLTGKTVILQTVPVDPYELLRGYSQTVRYDISNQDTLRELPGWETLPKQQPNGNRLLRGSSFHLILEEPAPNPAIELPQPWKPVAVSVEQPSQLQANQVAIKGIAYRSLSYGLESYYIPEDQRQQINAELTKAQQVNPNQSELLSPIVMEIKVNAQGDAVPVRLWTQFGEAEQQKIRRYDF
ncbi:MAG: GDYXXLXY domain-containing protein [Symploca sp. SIO2G7]|nr:GDYXXLXY domain-containing protein [Symploca sp. SIO2G7]